MDQLSRLYEGHFVFGRISEIKVTGTDKTGKLLFDVFDEDRHRCVSVVSAVCVVCIRSMSHTLHVDARCILNRGAFVLLFQDHAQVLDCTRVAIHGHEPRGAHP